MDITFYGSDEEMWEDLRRAMKEADSRVTEEQKRYRPGDIVLSDSGYGFPIFNEIQDIEKLVKKNLEKYGDDYEDEGIDALDLYREPHMRYYCFSKSYSEACPEGEFGDFHISQGLYRIPREVFEEVKKSGFRL
jgi:hypothetical protein